MVIIKKDELLAMVRDVLAVAGASQQNSEVVARHLVLANLSGVDTHGVWHLPGYVDGLRNGQIDGQASPAPIRHDANAMLVGGNWTFGHVAAEYAVERAIELAARRGVGVVGVVQCNHIGRLGHYTEMAANAGCIAQVWAGGFSEEAPVTVPHGGRDRLLHTNPISMAFPAEEEPPMMFDFATTAVAGTVIVNAQRRGEALPQGAIVDSAGFPSTDPRDFFQGGAHLPFGGHKGYAIGMAAEFFGRVLTGSRQYGDPARPDPVLRYQGVTMIVLRADLFREQLDFERDADEMERRARAVRPREGFSEVLVPGDPESRARAARLAEGIPVEDAIWDAISALPR